MDHNVGEQLFTCDDGRKFVKLNGYWAGEKIQKRVHQLANGENKDFQVLPDDIILATHVKTGTTWTKAMILKIRNYKANDNILNKDEIHGLIPNLEIQTSNYNADQEIQNLDRPRIYQTHVGWELLPPQIKANKCKLLYVTRNPKDTCLSLYKFTQKLSDKGTHFGDNDTLSNWVDNFTSVGRYHCGPFDKHVIGYWNNRQAHENMLFLFYEQMLADPVQTVLTLSNFIGCHSIDAKAAQQIAFECSFENMKNLGINEQRSPRFKFPLSSFYGKGQVGAWKDAFSEDDNEKLDKWIDDKFGCSDIKFTFLHT